MSREITVINRTSGVIGVMGGQIGPNGTKNFPLQKLQGTGLYGIGSNTKATKLAAQVAAGLVTVVLNGDKLSADQVTNLDAPISAELAIVREIFTNLTAADPNAFKTSFAAPAALTTYVPANFDGAVGAGTINPPRNFTITGTTGGGEALTSKAVVVTGVDINGGVQSETITTTVLGASDTHTDEGVIAFTQILSVRVPADPGAVGDYEFGFGTVVGLSAPLTQGGLIREFIDNSIVTTGTIVLAGTSAPNGTFKPATAPNDTHDYIAVYIPN